MVRPTFRQLVPATLLALSIVMAYDGYQIVTALRQQRVIAAQEIAVLRDANDPVLRFAWAYALQQEGDFEQALRAYAALDLTAGDAQQADIRFNMANLFLRRALVLRENESDDLAMPLIELAKQNYRDLLRENSAQWDAKYNLELALALAPEHDAIDVGEERNPEHSPRALTKTKAREPLP